MNIDSPDARLRTSMRARFAAITVVFAVLLLQMFAFISRHSVNILFSDQWDVYRPFFEDVNLWRTFAWQHGPPRLGVGMLVTKGLADVSGWNSTADAFAVGVVMSLATVAGLALKWRLFHSLSFFDVVIPLLCLTLFQYEALVVTPMLGHGALPVLMVLLYARALLIEHRSTRYAALLTLNFLLVYTGFGLFIAPITIALLLGEAYQSRGDTRLLGGIAIALSLAILSDLSFLVGYRFDTGAGGAVAMGTIVQYSQYVGLMLAAFWGWHASILGGLASVAGVVLLAIALGVCCIHGRRIVRNGLFANPASLIITVLVSYSILFCIFTAVGRLGLGIQYAQVSRYVTLAVPLYVGLYFHLLTLGQGWIRQVALPGYLMISLAGSLPLGIIDDVAQKTSIGKTSWKACYLKLEDAERCNQLTGFLIHPAVESLGSRLQYLKERRLNLYQDRR